jgi:uncharacterized protein (TIGR04255 family)
MNLPKKISPCPILESTVEIRFDSRVPSEAVFGIIYSEIQAQFPGQPEKMPILQLPEEVRSKDPNLIYQPLYRLKNNNYLISIGPKVISLSCTPPYSGWTEFSLKIQELLSKINKAKVISKTLRFGLRYINFFDENIFNNIKFEITLDNTSLSLNQNYIRTISKTKPFTITLQIANSADIVTDNKTLKGSLIDIDIAAEGSNIDILNVTNGLLSEGHDQEKQLFFTLLKDEFLLTLNPEY